MEKSQSSKRSPSKTTKIPIDKVKMIKELGHGIMGTVYLVTYKGKQYALKIEHILEEDIDDQSSPLWNEIRFAEDIANSNPEHFMTLNNYDFIDKCELKQEYAADLSHFPELKQKFLKKLAASPFCVRKIYSLVDTTLDKVELKSKEEVYSMIIQLLSIVHLMEKKGYVHADLHHGNIGVVNTKKKYIDILGHKIPTFGRIYQAIDYGGVLNEKTLNPTKKIMGLPDTQKDSYEWAKFGDKLGFMMSTINDGDFWDYVQKNNIKLDREEDTKNVLNAPEMGLIKELIKNKDLQFEFYRILFPEEFQKIVLGKNFKKVIDPIFRIPKEDLILFFLNFDNTPLLLEYFISRLDK
jgi:hypothetical protein